MRIALLTDTHIGYSRENGNHVFSHGASIVKKIRFLKEELLTDGITNIFFLGDIIDCNSKCIEQDYAVLLEIFKDFNIYGVFGNNESFIEYKEKYIFPEKLPYPTKGVLIEADDVHIFIEVDKKMKEEIRISHSEIGRLNSLCEKYQSKSIYWYMHYPITDDPNNLTHYHIDRPKDCFPENGFILRQIAEKYGVRKVFNGHTHLYFETIINGVDYRTIPSFSEDKNGKPQCEYGIFDTHTGVLEIKKI